MIVTIEPQGTPSRPPQCRFLVDSLWAPTVQAPLELRPEAHAQSLIVDLVIMKQLWGLGHFSPITATA